MAFVGHGSGRARAGGLQLFYRSGPISTPRVAAGVAHDGADQLSPEGLTLHSANLAESDIAEREGYRLTTPLRTILDLATGDAMPRAELSKALMEMVERRLITRSPVKSARIAEAFRLQLEELLGWEKR